ncbi:hypothetical protein ACOSQ4_009259 [Xanthoceras sorbifolium]
MGASSSTCSSSSATATHGGKYDLFISFRGEDIRIRDSFRSHCCEALSRKKIDFSVDDKLNRGYEIWPALSKAIEDSRISVVIFSKEYASSKWCLRELVKILECKETNGQIVIPVFYHADPSHVRKQKGSFKDALVNKHGKVSEDEKQKWRAALTEACNLSGFDYSKNILVILVYFCVLNISTYYCLVFSFGRSESEFVGEIVSNIWKKLNNIPSLTDFPNIIGIEKHIRRVISLLCLGESDFRMVGIWGMGGIGKTTIVDVVFHLISCQFENSCFVQCFRERSENYGGLIRLREEVLSEVLNEENLKLGSPSIPLSIKRRINYKKVFIVLDDVDNFKKLEILVGGLDRFGPGSRIILTTRDKQVLRNCGLDSHNICEVKVLNHDEALQLFCNYAFKQNHPTEDLMVLSKEVVNYAQGNPLALKVLGSSLYQKSKREWESAVDKLKRIPNPEILNVLKINYDGLDAEEKDLFLDIACFDTPLTLFQPFLKPNIASDREFSLSGLIDKSLVTMHDNGMIKMHDLLREMGREIVHEESPKKPGNRSRLWKNEDVLRTLKDDNGTAAVQGIILDSTTIKDVQLSSQVFEKMCNLRILIIKKLDKSTPNLSNGLDYLPHELRYLSWDSYPLEALPSSFNPENLVELNLSYSNIEQLWEGMKCVPKLKKLDLLYCRHLIRIPDLSDIPLVEHIQLVGCTSLLEIHSSTQCQKNLHSLQLTGCENLRNFPSNIHISLHFSLSGCISLIKLPQISGNMVYLDLSGSRLEEVPSTIQSLSKLEYLYVVGCKRLKNISTSICKLKSLQWLVLSECCKLESFPEILETMDLKCLKLSGTAIKELPSSIKNLNRLEELYLRDCEDLEKLPSSISNLRYLVSLDLCGCSKMENLPPLPSTKKLGLCYPEDIFYLSSLERLELSGNVFQSLPKSIKQLSKLEYLILNDCNMLHSITELPSGLRHLEAMNCKQLIQSLPDESEFELYVDGGGSMKFIFVNCLKLNLKAVSDVFGESLLKLQVMAIEKVSSLFKGIPFRGICDIPLEQHEKEVKVSICLPGSEIPEWFCYQNSGSSINIPRLQHDCGSSRYIMGFALCLVIRFEESYFHPYDALTVDYDFHIENSDGHEEAVFHDSFPLFPVVSWDKIKTGVSIDLDHIFLGYAFSPKYYDFFQKLDALPTNHSMSDYLGASFEFNLLHHCSPLDVEACKVKHCGVYPIYVKVDSVEELKNIAINQDTGETSGSNDAEETCEQRI